MSLTSIGVLAMVYTLPTIVFNNHNIGHGLYKVDIIIVVNIHVVTHYTAQQGAPFQITVALPDDIQCSYYIVSTCTYL